MAGYVDALGTHMGIRRLTVEDGKLVTAGDGLWRFEYALQSEETWAQQALTAKTAVPVTYVDSYVRHHVTSSSDMGSPLTQISLTPFLSRSAIHTCACEQSTLHSVCVPSSSATVIFTPAPSSVCVHWIASAPRIPSKFISNISSAGSSSAENPTSAGLSAAAIAPTSIHTAQHSASHPFMIFMPPIFSIFYRQPELTGLSFELHEAEPLQLGGTDVALESLSEEQLSALIERFTTALSGCLEAMPGRQTAE